MSLRTAPCPGCGATLTFLSAASVCIVCPYCGGGSMRTDRALESFGTVAELAPIESPLTLYQAGRFGGVGYTAVGLLQLDHGAGPWNEWCLLFDDGTWGWYAEAQGQTLFTRKDEVEQAWKLVGDILKTTEVEGGPTPFPYDAGSWGPTEADQLLARDGRVWRRL